MTLDEEIAIALQQASREIEERGFAAESDLQTWDDLKDVYGAIEWLWNRWLPRGFVTLLASVPGVGKSLLALTSAKIVTQGGIWPDGQEMPERFCKCLWVETENGEPFHILRAQNIGLRLSHVITPLTKNDNDVVISLTNPSHRKRIAAIAALDSVDIVIVDSLSGGNTLNENSTEVGEIVQWLSALAKKLNKPIILIHHMNKSAHDQSSGKPPSQGKIRGSGAILQHARVIWVLDTPDDERKDHLRLSCAKSNLGPHAMPMNIQIDGQGRLQWVRDGYIIPQNAIFEDYIRQVASKNPQLSVSQIAAQENISPAEVQRILRAAPQKIEPEGTQKDLF